LKRFRNKIIICIRNNIYIENNVHGECLYTAKYVRTHEICRFQYNSRYNEFQGTEKKVRYMKIRHRHNKSINHRNLRGNIIYQHITNVY